MSTYQIKLEGDILKVGFGATLTTGDQIVRDAATRLNQMIASGELPIVQVLANLLVSEYRG